MRIIQGIRHLQEHPPHALLLALGGAYLAFSLCPIAQQDLQREAFVDLMDMNSDWVGDRCRTDEQKGRQPCDKAGKELHGGS
jgi:hypothetical protein